MPLGHDVVTEAGCISIFTILINTLYLKTSPTVMRASLLVRTCSSENMCWPYFCRDEVLLP
jgi:hypothetical protein